MVVAVIEKLLVNITMIETFFGTNEPTLPTISGRLRKRQKVVVELRGEHGVNTASVSNYKIP